MIGSSSKDQKQDHADEGAGQSDTSLKRDQLHTVADAHVDRAARGMEEGSMGRPEAAAISITAL